MIDVCDLKQGYTQYGGLRPFGVSFLYAGYDINYGFQLYHSDPRLVFLLVVLVLLVRVVSVLCM